MSIQLTGSVDVFGSVSSSLFGTASWAENALSASYVEIVGDNITVNYIGNQIQLTGSAGGGAAFPYTGNAEITGSLNVSSGITGSLLGTASYVPNLQQVTTVRNQTSSSIGITGSLLATRIIGVGALLNTTNEGVLLNGYSVRATGDWSHAEGSGTTAANTAHAEGEGTTALGYASHTEGQSTVSIGMGSHAEGISTRAIGPNAHAEGSSTTAIGSGSHAEGWFSIASGSFSHAEGRQTRAIGSASHAEGQDALVRGNYAHGEGIGSLVNGDWAHGEGANCWASGSFSHAEGSAAKSFGQASHAEGIGSLSNSFGAHAEGWLTIASGFASHTEGRDTVAIATGSHAEGFSTFASASYQHAQGQWNAIRTEQSAVIIGDGTDNLNRANLFVALPTLQKIEVSGSLALNIGNYIDDAAAATAGVPLTGLYHTAGVVKIRLT
jgi:hypothetical protein